jgi:hypothetical protein
LNNGFKIQFAGAPGYTLNFTTNLNWTAAFPPTPVAYSNIKSQVNGAGTISRAQISVLSVAPVPEPATWAMMLGGFGLAGIVLRGRVAKAGLAR